MGLIGLTISAIMSATDSSKQPRPNGCYGGQQQQAYLVQQPQPQLMGTNPDYMAMNTGRSSCHQRKAERRYQKKMQRAERMQLRAEQRAERDYRREERRQAGVVMVQSGAQRVGMIGSRPSPNVYETRDFHEEPYNNGGYELGPMNQQQHAEKDAPPAYDDAVRK